MVLSQFIHWHSLWAKSFVYLDIKFAPIVLPHLFRFFSKNLVSALVTAFKNSSGAQISVGGGGGLIVAVAGIGIIRGELKIIARVSGLQIFYNAEPMAAAIVSLLADMDDTVTIDLSIFFGVRDLTKEGEYMRTACPMQNPWPQQL